MKIAIVCDDLIQFGGAEKLVMTVMEIWKGAPLYTSVASDKWLEICREKQIDLHTSFMQRMPFASELNRYLAPFFFQVIGFHSFDLSGFDVVLSISARFAQHVITKPQTKHICYINSPGRMFWEPFDYFQEEAYGFFKPIKKLAPYFLSMPLSFLRVLDYLSAKRADYVISNSGNVREKVKKYYGRDSVVINPYVDLKDFREPHTKPGDYFLIISRLVSWKRVDIAIKACEATKVPLKIIGEGPDKKRLQDLSRGATEFLGHVTDQEKLDLLCGCKALINTQFEDFGIVPLEAMACGKPVIAFGYGGAEETVKPGITGEFFYEQNPESLKKLLDKFDPDKYNPETCILRAKEFSKEKFKQKMIDFVNNVYL